MEHREYRGLRIAKDILFKTFIVGYVFLIVAWIIVMLGRGTWESMFVQQWHLGSPAFFELITISFFAMAKFVLFMYALIPACAICWTLRKIDKGKL